MKVARGRSWQPEIGMEHASRGRRSGNKGVGARWRGRFRIFSARHCSRTKVSHAENSGMTMTNPLVPSTPVVARRRMTTPVVAPRSGLNPPPNLRGGGGILLRLDWEPLRERTLSPFVLRVVAGACVGRGSGQPRMPPRERQHEGFDFFGLGNSFTPTGETRRVLMRVLFF